jgi:BMFP domain-containing protein YqiC
MEVSAMNTGPNRVLDEFAKLMTDAAGAAQGVRREVETAFRGQAERILNSMDVVQREEFEAARDMAAKARAENKALAARLDELEAKLAGLSGEKVSKPASSTASKARAKK